MASVARAIERAASCTVDECLWWDSHESLFHYLDDYVSGVGKVPSNQVLEKLQANHTWLLDSLLRFKAPNAKSRSALDVSRVVMGGHRLEINAEMKRVALQMSDKLVLDEVQAYILVSRSFSDEKLSANSDSFEKITLKYYTERQCLLKCMRLILLSQMAEPSDNFRAEPIDTEVKVLLKGGIESKCFTVLENLLTVEQPLDLDLTFMKLWAEEIVMEENLIMDIMFLLYYEPLSSCSFTRWKELFLMFQTKVFLGTNVERLSLTAEALRLVEHAKHQAVLILLEALDLDKLLLMVFDDVPFSQDRHPFSAHDLQQIDGLFGGLNALEVQEYAPLLLGWGIFGCLLSFLPVSDKGSVEIDHTAYIQQAHEVGAFKCVLDMLYHEGIQESHIDGYRCVIKSLISSFIAAYDIASQSDSTIMDTLVDILYSIYLGQEILCAEFWDRGSVLDSPLRNLLLSLRESFPYQLKPLVQLLAGLAEGAWPAECVYDFLYTPSEITCLYQHGRDILLTNDSQPISASVTLEVPGALGVLIPAGTVGHILKAIDDRTSVVLWKCKHSAIVLLVLRLMGLSVLGDSWAEVHTIVNLLHRILSANKMLVELLLELEDAEVCGEAHGDGRMEVTARVNILAVICMVLDKLMDVSGSNSTAALCMDILGIFAGCCPFKVMLELSKMQSPWSTSKFLDGGLLVKCLSSMCRDSQRSDGMHVLVIGVVDMCASLVAKEIHSESLSKIVLFIIGTLFVSHMTWKYEQKFERWRVTTKVFELAHIVLSNSGPNLIELKARVLELIMVDAAFHSVLLRILSTSTFDLRGLYFNRFADSKEIEWFEIALSRGLTLVHQALSNFLASISSNDCTSTTPLEHALLHHAVGAIPFVGCVASLTGLFQNQALQLASIKMLRTLCLVAGKARPHPLNISSYVQGYEQKQSLRMVFGKLLSKETAELNIELYNFSADFVTTAARFQPSFVEMLLYPIKQVNGLSVNPKERIRESVGRANMQEQLTFNEDTCSTLDESIWKILTQGTSFFQSQPHILSVILLLLRSLWQGGTEFPGILEAFRQRDGFWRMLVSYISHTLRVFEESINSDEWLVRSFQYQCQTSALQIMAGEFFLQQHKTFQQHIVYTGGNGDAKVANGISETRKSVNELSLVQLTKSLDPIKLIQSIAGSHYDKKVVVRAKAEMRGLMVGLMLKILANDELGLSAPLLGFLQESLKAVLNHSSFQGILSTYLSHGYGCGKELQVLVMTDLYFHLQGELEAGRHIPAGSFENLVQLIDTMDLTHLIYYGKEMQIKTSQPLHDDACLYDTTRLRQQLGLEWWSQTGSHILRTAENTLDALQRANIMACLGTSQVSALESLTSLFSCLVTNKQEVGIGSKSNWTDACILELCTAIESSVELLGPDGDPTHYMQSLLSAQSRLLLVLVQCFSICVEDSFSKVQVEMICTKVMRTLVASMRPILNSYSAIPSIQKQLIKSVLGAYLVCLELLQAQNDGPTLHEIESKHSNQNDDTAISHVALISMEFLPVLCSLVEDKYHASLAVAVICVLIKHFLAPQIWLPILQTHSTIQFALSLLHVAEDTDSAHQVLNLLLCLSHVRSGVEMLQSAGIFSHILVFAEKIKEEVSHVNEVEGPFCVWKSTRTKRHELWGLSVAIVAAILQSLGEDHRDNAVETAFVFFESQQERVLCALQSPHFSDTDGRKKTRFGQPETTILALQETQQVLHLMVALVRHHAQWSHVMGRSEVDFRHKCIHLLAYIAREGLMRNISSSVSACLCCHPVNKEEMFAHRKPSLMGCSAGWFALAAKGSSATNGSSNVGLDSQDFLSKWVKERSTQSEIGVVVPTEYSDSVALCVYKIALLLLEFLCKQAQHAASVIDEGGTFNYAVFPEFPAPEILYGLQDQVMSVITDICGRRSMAPIKKEAQKACCILLSIMERALFLEVCVSRICGMSPLSVRSEDFSKEFKALLVVVEGHRFLDASLKALKPIIALAYPALF